VTGGGKSNRDSPWLLAMLGVIAVVSLVLGCAGWSLILDGAAR
jgi:hypothetical protein